MLRGHQLKEMAIMMERLGRLQAKRDRGGWLTPWEWLQMLAGVFVLAMIALPLYIHMVTGGRGIC